MTPFVAGVILVALVGLAGLVLFLMWRIGERGARMHADLAGRLEHVREASEHRLAQLQQHMTVQLTSSQSLLHERTASFERTARELAGHFGRLQEAQGSLARMSTEILDFQKMLRSPSARGGFGEVLLEALLTDILPPDRYALQHTFSSGERVDAILKLADDRLVAVDAKFPLAAYEPLVRAEDPDERREGERAFAADVKERAKEISTKYIVEAEHTLPFAFMYIPSEGVFYEIVRRPDLWEAVTRQRVFPVSPNSFVPYVYTILVGLRGLKVQEEARSILAKLAGFQKDFGRVAEEFGKVGVHVQQALNRHGEAQKVFDRLRGRVEALSEGEERVAIPAAAAADGVPTPGAPRPGSP